MTQIYQLVQSFMDVQPIYDELGDKLTDVICASLDRATVKYHSVTHRVKSQNSLFRKIQDHPEKNYSTLESITDLLGLRVITYFVDDVDAVWNILKNEFELDLPNCVDKQAIENPTEFGYSSLHLVASLGSNRRQLSEYQKYTGLKFEIQIRTVLQHAWAEIEHDHVYKPKEAVPSDLRRIFSRIAALLEVADLDFQRMRNESERKQRQGLQKDAPLDGLTLIEFVKETEFVRLEEELRPFWTKAKAQHKSDEYLRRHIGQLNNLGITTVAQLRQELLRNHDRLVQYSHNRSQYIQNEVYPFGWSLMQLAQILYAERNEPEGVKHIVHMSYNATAGDLEDRYRVLKRIIAETPENGPNDEKVASVGPDG